MLPPKERSKRDKKLKTKRREKGIAGRRCSGDQSEALLNMGHPGPVGRNMTKPRAVKVPEHCASRNIAEKAEAVYVFGKYSLAG